LIRPLDGAVIVAYILLVTVLGAVGAFLADPLLNRILTAPEKDLRIRRIMDKGQVLLINLAKGRIGDDSSSLLGGLLVTAIGLAAHTRERRSGRDQQASSNCCRERDFPYHQSSSCWTPPDSERFRGGREVRTEGL